MRGAGPSDLGGTDRRRSRPRPLLDELGQFAPAPRDPTPLFLDVRRRGLAGARLGELGLLQVAGDGGVHLAIERRWSRPRFLTDVGLDPTTLPASPYRR